MKSDHHHPIRRFELRRSDGKEHMLSCRGSSSFSENTTVDFGDLGRSSLW